MTNIPHDHNFKHILLDFPVESLQFFFPNALEKWGAVQKITFVRNPKSINSQMPILCWICRFCSGLKRDLFCQLESRVDEQLFVYFRYIYCGLFDFNTRNFYTVNNPVVKILLPKMNYEPDERTEVIRQAYTGLFQLAALSLFEKYVAFIDLYADVKPDEHSSCVRNLYSMRRQPCWQNI